MMVSSSHLCLCCLMFCVRSVQCLASQLATVAELLRKARSEAGAVLEEQQALSSLTSLQDGVHTLQLLCTRSGQQLAAHLGATFQQQVGRDCVYTLKSHTDAVKVPSHLSSASSIAVTQEVPPLYDLDRFGLVQLAEVFPTVKDAPSLEVTTALQPLKG